MTGMLWRQHTRAERMARAAALRARYGETVRAYEQLKRPRTLFSSDHPRYSAIATEYGIVCGGGHSAWTAVGRMRIGKDPPTQPAGICISTASPRSYLDALVGVARRASGLAGSTLGRGGFRRRRQS